MEVQSVEVRPCELEINYVADPEVVKSKRTEALQNILKNNPKVPGFRQGKTPHDVLKHHFKKQIDAWVMNEMASVAYDDIIFETNVKPVGFPKFLSVELDSSNFSCRVFLIKKPSFELGDYKTFEIPPNTFPSLDDECSELVNNLLDRFAEIVPFSDDQEVVEGDSTTITIKANGQEESAIFYIVGSNDKPGLDEVLIGMKSGDVRPYLDGTVELHMGVSKTLPDFDDELAKNVGAENAEVLRNQIVAIATLQREQKKTNYARNFILKQLIERHSFEIPEVLANMEAQSIASQQGKKVEELAEEELVELFNKAKQQIKLSFLLDSIRELEVDATLADAEAKQALIARIAQNGNDPNPILKNMEASGTLIGILSALKDEYTVQWLIKQTGFLNEVVS
jgi:trigger factor